MDSRSLTPEPRKVRTSSRTPSPSRYSSYSRRDTYYGSPLTPRSGPPPRPVNAPRPEVNNVLGVFGLSIRTRERDLEDEFNRYGDVEKVTIVYDQRVSDE